MHFFFFFYWKRILENCNHKLINSSIRSWHVFLLRLTSTRIIVKHQSIIKFILISHWYVKLFSVMDKEINLSIKCTAIIKITYFVDQHMFWLWKRWLFWWLDTGCPSVTYWRPPMNEYRAISLVKFSLFGELAVQVHRKITTKTLG